MWKELLEADANCATPLEMPLMNGAVRERVMRVYAAECTRSLEEWTTFKIESYSYSLSLPLSVSFSRETGAAPGRQELLQLAK